MHHSSTSKSSYFPQFSKPSRNSHANTSAAHPNAAASFWFSPLASHSILPSPTLTSFSTWIWLCLAREWRRLALSWSALLHSSTQPLQISPDPGFAHFCWWVCNLSITCYKCSITFRLILNARALICKWSCCATILSSRLGTGMNVHEEFVYFSWTSCVLFLFFSSFSLSSFWSFKIKIEVQISNWNGYITDYVLTLANVQLTWYSIFLQIGL